MTHSTRNTTPSDPFTLQLPMTPRAIPAARRGLQQAIAAWALDPDVADDVLLVANELATNAVCHARVPGRLWQLVAVRRDDRVRVEVSDTNNDRAPAARSSAPLAENGRGLTLVALLTGGTWGVTERVVGKTVWAEIACNQSEGS